MIRSNHFSSTLELNSVSQQVLSALPGQVAIVNESGEIVAHNAKWTSLRELVEEKWAFPLLGENVLNILQYPLSMNNDYALRFIIAYKSVLTGENESVKVLYPVTLDSQKWFCLTISALEEKEYFLLVNEDISDEMEAKSNLTDRNVRLHLSEERYKDQFKNSLDGIIIAEQNGKIFNANPAACKMLGYNAEELIGQKREFLIDSTDPKVIEVITKRDKNNFYHGEFEFISKTGRKVLVELKNRVVKGEDGTSHSILSFRDLTTIRQQERFFRKLFNSSPNAIALLDIEGKVQETNKSFETVFEYQDFETKGKYLPDLIVSETEITEAEQIIEKVISGEEVSLEGFRYTKTGKQIPVIMSMFPIWNDSETEIASIFCIYVDHSEQHHTRKVIEDQLKENEILLQEIHHRVKNNLAIISGLISLENFYSSDEVAKQQLSLTQSRIHSIAKIHELLYDNEDFTRIDFQKYVSDLASSFSKSSELEFISETSQSILLNVNQAVPCGMLLHEISNLIALRGNSNPGSNNTVTFNLSVLEEQFVITICEPYGRSLFDFMNKKEDRLASELISVLIRQLHGSIEIIGKDKTCIVISFKKRDKKGAHSAIL
ncbi:MAG: PAS domain S-box protein [Balneola sp.]|nr:MAG: PAS domain S-box protein [Balneola sp.]